MAKVLVICPTHDHADALFASIASVRAQTFTEWEMAVICDGSPPRTEQILKAICEQEPRVRVYRHPKGERFGESYRDPVIRESDAEFICHLSDDDIWLNSHLDQMVALLEHVEWANQAPARFTPGGALEWWPVNHGTEVMRAACARRAPLSAGINYVAYRRSSYLRLPDGWTCAPPEARTSDVFMWSKFFRLPNLSVASIACTTALKFPSRMNGREVWTPEQRLVEISPWLARSADPGLPHLVRRSGLVFHRFVALFALHGIGDDARQSLGLAGFSPVPEHHMPEIAIDGSPMLLPLTDAQSKEIEQAHHFVAAFVQTENQAGNEGALALSPEDWLAAARKLAILLGPVRCLRALEAGCRRYPGHLGLARRRAAIAKQ